jgi:ribosome biogenesis GTPase A
MKKTKELIVENLKVVDLIIEILDARIPILVRILILKN